MLREVFKRVLKLCEVHSDKIAGYIHQTKLKVKYVKHNNNNNKTIITWTHIYKTWSLSVTLISVMTCSLLNTETKCTVKLLWHQKSTIKKIKNKKIQNKKKKRNHTHPSKLRLNFLLKYINTKKVNVYPLFCKHLFIWLPPFF